jgi:hypothetical protein
LRRKARILLLSLALFTLAGVAPSCGSGRGAYCDAKCDCEGCSAVGYDDCLAHDDDDYRSSDVNGCLDYYDELAACQEATAVCVGAHFETKCGPEHDRWKNCMDSGRKH